MLQDPARPLTCGWDVSTSAIGWVALGDRGEIVSADVLDLSGTKRHVDKYLQAWEYVQGLEAIADGSVHYVEDRLGGFTQGKTTVQTLMSLAAMNGVVTCALARRSGADAVRHILPVSVKAIVGLKVPRGGDKKLVAYDTALLAEAAFFSSPRWIRPRAGGPTKLCLDVVDAWITARAGMIRDGGLRVG